MTKCAECNCDLLEDEAESGARWFCCSGKMLCANCYYEGTSCCDPHASDYDDEEEYEG